MGFPHTKSAPAMFIYLFICLRDRSASHVVSSFGVSTREDWVPVYCVPFMFRQVSLADQRSQVIGRRSQVAGRSSQVTGHEIKNIPKRHKTDA